MTNRRKAWSGADASKAIVEALGGLHPAETYWSRASVADLLEVLRIARESSEGVSPGAIAGVFVAVLAELDPRRGRIGVSSLERLGALSGFSRSVAARAFRALHEGGIVEIDLESRTSLRFRLGSTLEREAERSGGGWCRGRHHLSEGGGTVGDSTSRVGGTVGGISWCRGRYHPVSRAEPLTDTEQTSNPIRGPELQTNQDPDPPGQRERKRNYAGFDRGEGEIRIRKEPRSGFRKGAVSDEVRAKLVEIGIQDYLVEYMAGGVSMARVATILEEARSRKLSREDLVPWMIAALSRDREREEGVPRGTI